MRTAPALLFIGSLAALCATIRPERVAAQPTETEAQPPGQAFYDQAREAYGDEDYATAASLLRQAIQAEPLSGRYYVGLARALFYTDDYEQAVYYYDLYLGQFPEHARQARRRADREEAIRRERNEANQQRANPEAPIQLPANQQAALAAFRQRLQTGPIVTLDNTGAYAFYQTLLRTGYANPDLQVIKDRLIEVLLAEARDCFNPRADALIPILNLEEWNLVHERYRIVQQLGRPIDGVAEIEARIFAAQGQTDLINANYGQAAERFRQALTRDPTLLLAHYGQLYALHQRKMVEGQPLEAGVMTLMSDLENLTRIQAPQYMQMVPLMRSVLLADMGRYDDAAALIVELLAPGHVTGVPPGTAVPSTGIKPP